MSDRTLAADAARFSRSVFDGSTPGSRPALCRELAEALAHRFAGSGLPWADLGYAVIDELRSLGHDLWSFDEGEDFQIWGGDYMHPDTAGKLELMFHPPSEVEVVWHAGHDDSISVRAGRCTKGPHE
jgi:hypothetical protein